MSGGAPLWRSAFDRAERTVGTPLEEAVASRRMSEQIPFPGAAFEELADQWLRHNAHFNDTPRVGGRAVSLGDIRTPTLAAIAERDEIVPEAAAAPIADRLDGTHVDVLTLDAGHASLATGRKAAKVTVPRVLVWLTDHSEEAA